MNCPRCGAEISDKANRCNHCGLKINIICPECNTVNRFGSKFCKNCGFDFLITCPVCGSTNTYQAKECRKCHSELTVNKDAEAQKNKPVATECEVVNAFSSGESAISSETKKEEEIIEQSVINQPEDGGIPYVQDLNDKNSGNNNKEKYFNVDEDIKEKEKAQQQTIQEENNQTIIEDSSANTVEAEITEEKSALQEAAPSTVNVLEEENLIKQTPVDDSILTEIFEEEDNDISEPKQEVEELVKEEAIEQEQAQEEEQEEGFPEKTSFVNIQTDTIEKITNLLTNSLNKHVIAINGPEGSGKTAILNHISEIFSEKGFIPLYGSCTPLVQITSFGFFQDALLRMMGFPPYTNSVEGFIKEFKKSKFAKLFSSLNPQEIQLFLNIFYPSQKDRFENILDNKQRMFVILEKVIKSFLENNNLIIVIDNFELLDGASYDFIIHMLKKGYFNNRVKLLVAYQENKSILSYFNLNSDEDKIFETIVIKKLDKKGIIEAVNSSFGFNLEEVLPADYLNELITKSEGNAIRLEQEIALLVDTGYITTDGNKVFVDNDKYPELKPNSFEELIKLRLNALTPVAKNILFMAAIMGYRFATGVLCQAAALQADKAVNLLGLLIQEMYIKQVDSYTCEFKNLSLWKLIYNEAKADLLYKENSVKLYNTLKPLILSSNLQKLISCAEALPGNEAFTIWQNTASITAKLGDTNLYVIAQKQCLKIMEEQVIEDSEKIQAKIYEEIGKLLCEKSPKESVTYLANVLDAEIKANNVRKIIDISGYFVKSCYLSGNYFGVTEAVDTIIKTLENIPNASRIDIALVKTRKLRALLNIGNSEQIINLANEEILPEINKHLEINQADPRLRNMLINGWLVTKIILAKAYGIQGNCKISDMVTEIRRFLEIYNRDSAYYLVQTDILDAFANTVEGYLNKSNEILNHISAAYKDRRMETNLLAEWNLINIINRVLSGENTDLKIDLFELAAFANNINEHFIKNIVKLILGYVLEQEGDSAKALEIYNEEITYFAKEKVAIGALLAWGLIVQSSLETGDEVKAMDTATKSLDIAKSPKINNNFFIIYFKRILSQIYLQRRDFDAAKMYLEEAIVIAKQFNLKYQLCELYLDYAKYTEELMKEKRIYSQANLNIAYDLYNKAVNTAKDLKLPNLSDKTYKARAGFKTFCQLNSLELKA